MTTDGAVNYQIRFFFDSILDESLSCWTFSSFLFFIIQTNVSTSSAYKGKKANERHDDHIKKKETQELVS